MAEVGQILVRASFSEPVRLVTVKQEGDGAWTLGLIEVKGIGAPDGTVLLTPNEHRVAENRRDCYWLYVVTNSNAELELWTIKDLVSFDWKAVQKVQHYTLPTRELNNG